jgi:hypothetical protein
MSNRNNSNYNYNTRRNSESAYNYRYNNNNNNYPNNNNPNPRYSRRNTYNPNYRPYNPPYYSNSNFSRFSSTPSSTFASLNNGYPTFRNDYNTRNNNPNILSFAEKVRTGRTLMRALLPSKPDTKRIWEEELDYGNKITDQMAAEFYESQQKKSQINMDPSEFQKLLDFNFSSSKESSASNKKNKKKSKKKTPQKSRRKKIISDDCDDDINSSATSDSSEDESDCNTSNDYTSESDSDSDKHKRRKSKRVKKLRKEKHKKDSEEKTTIKKVNKDKKLPLTNELQTPYYNFTCHKCTGSWPKYLYTQCPLCNPPEDLSKISSPNVSRTARIRKPVNYVEFDENDEFTTSSIVYNPEKQFGTETSISDIGQSMTDETYRENPDNEKARLRFNRERHINYHLKPYFNSKMNKLEKDKFKTELMKFSSPNEKMDWKKLLEDNDLFQRICSFFNKPFDENEYKN